VNFWLLTYSLIVSVDIFSIKNLPFRLNLFLNQILVRKEVLYSLLHKILRGLTDFDLKIYLLFNLGCFLLIFAISSISFFASCFFNLSKNAMAIVAGVPLAFFVLSIVAKMSDSLANAKYFTLNTLFDTSAIQNGTGYIPQLIALGLIGLVFYTAGLLVFKNKDLPL
jgi:ABC-2 type transport system permease protein